jgi:hypothetical protein
MWHRRAFFGARSRELLSALLGLTFRGTRGLVVDSTAEGGGFERWFLAADYRLPAAGGQPRLLFGGTFSPP